MPSITAQRKEILIKSELFFKIDKAYKYTTSIYASADITMMKNALEGVSKKDATGNIEIPVWQGDEDMILSLCGLK